MWVYSEKEYKRINSGFNDCSFSLCRGDIPNKTTRARIIKIETLSFPIRYACTDFLIFVIPFGDKRIRPLRYIGFPSPALRAIHEPCIWLSHLFFTRLCRNTVVSILHRRTIIWICYALQLSSCIEKFMSFYTITLYWFLILIMVTNLFCKSKCCVDINGVRHEIKQIDY